MAELLSKERVEKLFQLLNEEQKDFLNQYCVQNKKSKWLETLANKKGIVIDNDMDLETIEQQIDDWILLDIQDGGFGNKPYKCECGAALRFQYIVHHKTENRTYKLGETCFGNYTKLSPEILKDIKNGLYKIDLERDEILLKFYRKDILPSTHYDQIKGIPENIIKQIKVGLPLTDNQLTKATIIKNNFLLEKKNTDIFNQLNLKQKEFFRKLSKEHQTETLKKIQNDDFFEGYDIEDIPFDIKEHIEMEFPLLDSQISTILNINKQKIVSSFTTNRIAPNINNSYRNKAVMKEIVPNNIDYASLINMHLSTLKKVREQEKTTGIKSESLIIDWVRIQQMTKDLKNNKEIDYPIFKLLLSNLCNALRVERDKYL